MPKRLEIDPRAFFWPRYSQDDEAVLIWDPGIVAQLTLEPISAINSPATIWVWDCGKWLIIAVVIA